MLPGLRLIAATFFCGFVVVFAGLRVAASLNGLHEGVPVTATQASPAAAVDARGLGEAAKPVMYDLRFAVRSASQAPEPLNVSALVIDRAAPFEVGPPLPLVLPESKMARTDVVAPAREAMLEPVEATGAVAPSKAEALSVDNRSAAPSPEPEPPGVEPAVPVATIEPAIPAAATAEPEAPAAAPVQPETPAASVQPETLSASVQPETPAAAELATAPPAAPPEVAMAAAPSAAIEPDDPAPPPVAQEAPHPLEIVPPPLPRPAPDASTVASQAATPARSTASSAPRAAARKKRVRVARHAAPAAAAAAPAFGTFNTPGFPFAAPR